MLAEEPLVFPRSKRLRAVQTASDSFWSRTGSVPPVMEGARPENPPGQSCRFLKSVCNYLAGTMMGNAGSHAFSNQIGRKAEGSGDGAGKVSPPAEMILV